MLCGQSSQPMDTGSIIDLERVITEYAWRELKRDIKWYDCMKRHCFLFEVPWNFFEFDHRTTQFQLRTGGAEGGYREKKQVELFTTDFTNNTNKDQVYKLRTQRQTKAATSVAIQRGFTLKGNTNFKLKIPTEIGHFGVSASADGYLRVCRPRGETFEDTFTWQVDSDVTVEPNHVTNARLLVTEDELVADFEVKTLMRMPTGEAPVIVRRRNNKDIYAVMMISNLKDVFCDVDCKIIDIGPPGKHPEHGKKYSRYAIEFITTGILESVRWRNQKIRLVSCPIEDDTDTEGTTEIKAGSPIATEEQCKYPSPGFGKSGEPNQIYGHVKTKTKDLRFNMVPTVIADKKDDTAHEAPDSVLTTFIREKMRLSPYTPPTDQSLQKEEVLSSDISCKKYVVPVLSDSKQDETSSIAGKNNIKDICSSEVYTTSLDEPYLFRKQSSEPRALNQPEPSTTIITDDLKHLEPGYQTQLEQFYFQTGSHTGYQPLPRDITLITEEPEMEQATSISKQSSVQSQDTIDDASESLDSGDSRRVSKVTSV